LALENLALRQQLAVWKARQHRPRTIQRVIDDIPAGPGPERGLGAAPGCTNPGGAFTFERDGEIYELCSEACRAPFERPTG
jgi:hypothetical protein